MRKMYRVELHKVMVLAVDARSEEEAATIAERCANGGTEPRWETAVVTEGLK